METDHIDTLIMRTKDYHLPVEKDIAKADIEEYNCYNCFHILLENMSFICILDKYYHLTIYFKYIMIRNVL